MWKWLDEIINPPTIELPYVHLISGEDFARIESADTNRFLGNCAAMVLATSKCIVLVDNNTVIANVSERKEIYDDFFKKNFTAQELSCIFWILCFYYAGHVPRKICVLRNNDLAQQVKQLPGAKNLTALEEERKKRDPPGGSSGRSANDRYMDDTPIFIATSGC